MELIDLLKTKAAEHGFPISGGVDLDEALATHWPRHVEKYDAWLEKGFDGEMAYLRRGRDRRVDPRLVFPAAQSIFCVGVPYWSQPIGDSETPRYARYLKGPDYHKSIEKRLETLLKEAATASAFEFKWKVCVDTSAVLERGWATLSGLGWIGKNTTLIHPQEGSYFFIAEILLDQKLQTQVIPAPNYCGNCTRCIDACPTQALSSDQGLDARRCISYWTLEKRGALEISESDKKSLGTWVAGCDVCQEVCPFNTKASRRTEPAPPKHLDATHLTDWNSLLDESKEQYNIRVQSSALKRVKPEQFSRNLAIAFRNFLAANPTHALQYKEALHARIAEEKDPAALQEWSNVWNLFLNAGAEDRTED